MGRGNGSGSAEHNDQSQKGIKRYSSNARQRGGGDVREGGERRRRFKGSTKSPSTSAHSGDATSIPREDLLHLSMKLTKRLKLLEEKHAAMTS